MSSHAWDDARRSGGDDPTVSGPVAMLLAAIGFGLAGQQLFFDRAAGVNILVATALFLVCSWGLAWGARPRGRRPDLTDVWLAPAALTLAALCAIRADVALVALDAAVAATLALAWIAALGGARITRLDAGALLGEAADGIAGVVDRPVRLARAAAGPIAEAMRARSRRTGRLPGYAGGAALAGPFVIAFSVLFASADPVYARRLNDLLDAVRDAELLRDAGPRLLMGLVIAWLAAAALSKLERPPVPHPPARIRGVIGVDAAVVLLACVDLLFAAFVALQIGYLFGGRDTMDAAGLPYSAYARRGFFELIGAASLVGALLFGVGLHGRARSAVTTALGAALVGLTLAVLASAWYRLDLYQRAYGWTELRFYAAAAIVFLACALVVLGWSVLVDRMRFALQPLAGAALLIALAVNVVSPSAFVASADLQRRIDPAGLPADAERRMDPAYLVSLGAGAFPVLVERLPSLPPEDRELLRAWLRTTAARQPRTPDRWESFSLDRARARDALDAIAR